jgi:hypothetical protein
MDGDDVAVLDTQVVANDAVYAGRAIVELIVVEHNEDRILALLALDQHSVTTEQLQRLHRVVRKSDDGVVIVGGVGDTRDDRSANVLELQSAVTQAVEVTHINELGFFFFFKMAVAVSSS